MSDKLHNNRHMSRARDAHKSFARDHGYSGFMGTEVPVRVFMQNGEFTRPN